jgi:hypothetical protein
VLDTTQIRPDLEIESTTFKPRADKANQKSHTNLSSADISKNQDHQIVPISVKRIQMTPRAEYHFQSIVLRDISGDHLNFVSSKCERFSAKVGDLIPKFGTIVEVKGSRVYSDTKRFISRGHFRQCSRSVLVSELPSFGRYQRHNVNYLALAKSYLGAGAPLPVIQKNPNQEFAYQRLVRPVQYMR